MTDTIQTVVDALKDNWIRTNSDSIVPLITPIFEKKRVGGLDGVKTWIGIYLPDGETETPLGLGYTHVDRLAHATVDIRTSETYDHSLHCRDEIKRILRANRKGLGDFDLVQLMKATDLSDASIKMYRWIIEVQLTIYSEAL